jgi:hypothetical protein
MSGKKKGNVIINLEKQIKCSLHAETSQVSGSISPTTSPNKNQTAIMMPIILDVVQGSLVETDISEVFPAFISALTMEAVSTSEMSANFCQTTLHNIPEDSHLHTCDYKELKSYQSDYCSQASMSTSRFLELISLM